MESEDLNLNKDSALGAGNDSKGGDGFIDRSKLRILLCNNDSKSSEEVCDDRHSELIPCLDRHLIYQMRMKLDLSVMEHYERHCPPSERWYNCLIPPPPGYKIPIKWP